MQCGWGRRQCREKSLGRERVEMKDPGKEPWSNQEEAGHDWTFGAAVILYNGLHALLLLIASLASHSDFCWMSRSPPAPARRLRPACAPPALPWQGGRVQPCKAASPVGRRVIPFCPSSSHCTYCK